MTDTDTDALIDQLDDETVLRVNFHGHTDQFVYRFPSGIMTTVWGDRSIASGKIGIMSEDHVRGVISKRDADALELVPFSDSPYAAGWADD